MNDVISFCYKTDLLPLQVISHAIETCDIIAKFSESDYGKNSTEILSLYTKKIFDLYANSYTLSTNNITKGTTANFSLEKYNINQSYNHIDPDILIVKHYDPTLHWKERTLLKKNNISLNDFADNMHKTYDYIDFNYCSSKIPFLKDFFGMDYDEKDPDIIKYEKLRLLQILIECCHQYDIQLKSLLKASIYRFQINIPSRYKEAISFIRNNILAYRKSPTPSVSIDSVMNLELFVSKIRNIITSIPEKAIQSILTNTPPSLSQQYWIKFRIYCMIIDHAKATLKTKKLFSPTDIQAYAYTNFISLRLYDKIDFVEKYIINPPVKNILDSTSHTYKKITQTYSGPVEYAKCQDFLNKNINTIITDILKYELNDSSIKRYKRNLNDYLHMIQLYRIGFHKTSHNYVNQQDIVCLVYLYDLLKSNKIIIPIKSGYGDDSKRKDKAFLKIKSVLKLLFNAKSPSANWLQDELKDCSVSAFPAKIWLLEIMNAVLNHHNFHLYCLHHQAIIALTNFLHNEITPLNDDAGEYANRNIIPELEKNLFPLEERQMLCNQVNNMITSSLNFSDV